MCLILFFREFSMCLIGVLSKLPLDYHYKFRLVYDQVNVCILTLAGAKYIITPDKSH